MTLVVIHLLACTALIAAAFYRIARAGPTPTAHKFLFPYIIAASLFGMVLSYLYAMELFVAWYSGADPAYDPTKTLPTGLYGWLYFSLPVTPLLPAAAIIPWIGKRPLLVALLGILAPLPDLVMILDDREALDPWPISSYVWLHVASSFWRVSP
jgi:hypothetical protein